MTGLAALVHGLAGRSAVDAVLLVSHDGLPIQHAASSPVEPETIAALAATVGQHAGRLGQGAERGQLHTAVLEFSKGLFVLARLGDGDWLALVTRPDADIGALLYDLRQHRPAITSLL
jgi:predicted regulator of Ras-like GTPase activity (Roadblock/LC7/MglB family)